ncbi:MAG TPA: hypothetical protein DCY63_04220 [Acidimicrobiaceae bacterium]|nr:hypothetical protein [Acidimicrobiaceae bacterium]
MLDHVIECTQTDSIVQFNSQVHHSLPPENVHRQLEPSPSNDILGQRIVREDRRPIHYISQRRRQQMHPTTTRLVRLHQQEPRLLALNQYGHRFANNDTRCQSNDPNKRNTKHQASTTICVE